jgi:Tir chaperone protein (CesT) family
MRVDQLVRELGVRLGLPLALDGNGMCRLVFNGGMNVDVEALRDDGEKFIIYSVLAKLRPGPRGALYQALLEANLPTENGGAGVLALDVEAG